MTIFSESGGGEAAAPIQEPVSPVSMAKDPIRALLPTVTVAIINYNYSAFVYEAITSVISQTYPFIECVVVDDCSTDDSMTVINRAKEQFPHIKVYENEKNGGQSAATLNAIDKSTGSYLIFLDADDYLFPTCVATHIQTHLALRIPAGFTSVNMAQVQNGRIITTASPCLSQFIASGEGVTANVLHEQDGGWNFPDPPLTKSQLRHVVVYVEAVGASGWPWSPTSGNCFRREALELIIRNDRLPSLRSCTDCYLLRGVACLTGSVLIDLTLVAYRLHGKNDFAKFANLNRIRPYDIGYLQTRTAQAMKMLIDHLMDNASLLYQQMEDPNFFREALDALDGVNPPLSDSPKTYVTTKLIEGRARLRVQLGAQEYDRWLARKSIPRLVRLPIIGKTIGRIFACAIAPIMEWITTPKNSSQNLNQNQRTQKLS